MPAGAWRQDTEGGLRVKGHVTQLLDTLPSRLNYLPTYLPFHCATLVIFIRVVALSPLGALSPNMASASVLPRAFMVHTNIRPRLLNAVRQKPIETLTWVKQVFANRRTAKYKNKKIPISIEGAGIKQTSTLGEFYDVIEKQYKNTVKAFDILRFQVPQNLWPTPDAMREVPSPSLFELVWRDKLNGSKETRDQFNHEALKGNRHFSRYLVWTIQFFAEERDQPQYTHGLRLVKSGHEISHCHPEVTVVCSGVQYDAEGKLYLQHSDIFLGSSNEKTNSFGALHYLTRKGRDDALQPIRNKYGDFIDKL
ncbi:hypothetical protein CMUS01_15689 [Colletotrichum musicola]|uniref:Uncharacterized protein n=1 Tax=Colletotrichum musicola TaxID=2175873 RepID=A0A8H6MM55_9PEZI|nr:hypothetical protein CMUS01_15689 [Colletotrichum musicola]